MVGSECRRRPDALADAKMIGAKTIGVDRRAPGEDTPVADGINAFVRFDPDADVAGELRGLTRERGVDPVHDAVGGVDDVGGARVTGTPRAAGGHRRRR
jgi:NADPH:quinone reductase-like Zn-dependent oxidoreductase